MRELSCFSSSKRTKWYSIKVVISLNDAFRDQLVAILYLQLMLMTSSINYRREDGVSDDRLAFSRSERMAGWFSEFYTFPWQEYFFIAILFAFMQSCLPSINNQARVYFYRWVRGIWAGELVKQQNEAKCLGTSSRGKSGSENHQHRNARMHVCISY